jgi:hypothetical protein
MRRRTKLQDNTIRPLKSLGNVSRSLFYVHGTYANKSYTRGGYTSESEARAAAYQLFAGTDGTWTVEELPTRNLQRAKAILRDRDLSKGMNIKQAMRPHYHNVKIQRIS